MRYRQASTRQIWAPRSVCAQGEQIRKIIGASTQIPPHSYWQVPEHYEGWAILPKLSWLAAFAGIGQDPYGDGYARVQEFALGLIPKQYNLLNLCEVSSRTPHILTGMGERWRWLESQDENNFCVIPIAFVLDKRPPLVTGRKAMENGNAWPLTVAHIACYIAINQPPTEEIVTCLEVSGDEVWDNDGQCDDWFAFVLGGGGLEFGYGLEGDGHPADKGYTSLVGLMPRIPS